MNDERPSTGFQAVAEKTQGPLKWALNPVAIVVASVLTTIIANAAVLLQGDYGWPGATVMLVATGLIGAFAGSVIWSYTRKVFNVVAAFLACVVSGGIVCFMLYGDSYIKYDKGVVESVLGADETPSIADLFVAPAEGSEYHHVSVEWRPPFVDRSGRLVVYSQLTKEEYRLPEDVVDETARWWLEQVKTRGKARFK